MGVICSYLCANDGKTYVSKKNCFNVLRQLKGGAYHAKVCN